MGGIFFETTVASNTCRFVCCKPVIREKEKGVLYVWDVFHVLLLLVRTFVFGLRKKPFKTP